MDRYKKPAGFVYSPFIINPQPNFALTGRPLARLVPDSFHSEYSRRYIYLINLIFFIIFFFSYVFPDSSKVEKFPWLRSW